MSLVPSHLKTRDSFGEYCNQLELVKYAVEVGVHQGMFAKRFLSTWHGRCLVAIDPWSTGLEGYGEMRWDRTPDMMLAMINLAEHAAAGRLQIRREENSPSLIESIVKWCGPVDFVYIDANHEYEYIKRDIDLWWPHVSPGGILAGHDYFEPLTPGVVKVVNEFCQQKHVTGFIIDEPIGPSWYVRKPV